MIEKIESNDGKVGEGEIGRKDSFVVVVVVWDAFTHLEVLLK